MTLFVAEVFAILGQRHPMTDSDTADGKPGFTFMGQTVCFVGLSTLLGIGLSRARRLRQAAVRGQDCPLDGRLKKCRPTGKMILQSHKRSQVFHFLTEVYLKHSEPAPECNSAGPQAPEKKLQFRRACRRGKRPRREKKKESAKDWDEETAKGLRMLPPGSYKDYHRLFLSKHPECVVSYKLFTRAPCL